MTLRCYLYAKVLLCLVFLITGCGRTAAVPVTPTPASTPGTTSLTYVVQRGKVIKKLEFTGRISPVEEVPLHFKTSGYVKRVLVQPGDQVKAGDLLAELEIDGLQNQVASAELNLAVAQARLTQAEEANAYAITQAEISLEMTQEQLARAKSLQATYTAGIVRARVGLEQAKDQVERAEAEYQEALDRPWIPPPASWVSIWMAERQYQDALRRPWEVPDVRDAYARELQQAQWNLEIAQAQYDQAIAEEKVYQHELKMQEIAVNQAEAELEQLKKGVGPVLVVEVQQAQQALDQLKESSQIIAPVDGEIVSLSLYLGRLVEPFRTVIVIANPSAIEVSADLSNDQLKEMTEGQKAAVILATNPERNWTGTVRLLPYPYGTGGGIESPAVADNSTRINLEGDVSELRLGDLVRVTIVLEEKDDALWLPPAAIRTFQDRTFVIVQEEERQRRVDIEMGIESQDRVEILKGLAEGQVVVVP